MELKEIVDNLDRKMTEIHEHYVSLHKEFDSYRGKEVGDKVEEVNKLLYDIQSTFQELYPALHFIGSRHQYACNISKDHHEFIESIIKAGGKSYDPEEVVES